MTDVSLCVLSLRRKCTYYYVTCCARKINTSMSFICGALAINSTPCYNDVTRWGFVTGPTLVPGYTFDTFMLNHRISFAATDIEPDEFLGTLSFLNKCSAVGELSPKELRF